jgi:hypothetical protein
MGLLGAMQDKGHYYYSNEPRSSLFAPDSSSVRPSPPLVCVL